MRRRRACPPCARQGDGIRPRSKSIVVTLALVASRLDHAELSRTRRIVETIALALQQQHKLQPGFIQNISALRQGPPDPGVAAWRMRRAGSGRRSGWPVTPSAWARGWRIFPSGCELPHREAARKHARRLPTSHSRERTGIHMRSFTGTAVVRLLASSGQSRR
jgi:hypothetical protein